MENVIEVALNQMPLGVLVFDEKMSVIYQNRTSDEFMERYRIFSELTSVSKGIFADNHFRTKRMFQEKRCFRRSVSGVSGNVTASFCYAETPYPRLTVFMSEDLCCGRLNVQAISDKYELTNKETEVLRQLVMGLKNTDIARSIDIKEQTVRDHLRHIYSKCGVKNKFTLIRNVLTSMEV